MGWASLGLRITFWLRKDLGLGEERREKETVYDYHRGLMGKTLSLRPVTHHES